MQTELSRVETYSKRKKSKKVPMLAAGLLTLSLGAGQVYAAATGTDLLQLIKDMFTKTSQKVTADTSQDLENLRKLYTDKIKGLVANKKDNAVREIESHQDSEIQRANDELNTYVNQKAAELDKPISDQKDTIKKNITDQVNTGIASIKNDIDEARDRELRAQANQ